MGVFIRQFRALAWKNLLVLFQHPLLNIIRCFLLPVGYGVFLAVAQIFLVKPDYLGLGAPHSISDLSSTYDGSARLLWTASPSLNITPNSRLTPDAIISRISQGFNDKQKKGLVRVGTPDDIPPQCPQNFNGFSECHAAIVFNSFPSPPSSSNTSSFNITSFNASDPTSFSYPNAINYTIRADGGLYHIDVRGRSDYERRIFPIQLALDKAIAELSTNATLPTPQEWPFTQQTNEEQRTQIRLSYIRGLRTLLVIALFIAFVGIAYTLPGAFGAERASLLTAHLKAMGLRDSARILSWHITHSLSYLPAWVIVALIWHFRIFTGTHVLLVLVLHLLLGLVLASHGLFLAVPFGKSPQLAAVASTFGAIVSAILALVFSRAGTGAAVIFSLIFPGGFYVFAIRCICGWENRQIPTNALKGDPDSGLVLLPFLIVAIVDILLYPYLAVLMERWLYDAHEPGSTGPWWNPFKSTRSSRTQDAEKARSELSPDIAISIRNLHKSYPAPLLRRSRGPVTAVSDLSLDIPNKGIFVLLGSNGAGKSTTLSILGGLLGRTSGEVVFQGGKGRKGRPERGDIGIVPQKNVLFEELSCLQNVRVWRAVKRPLSAARGDGEEEEDLEQLLRDCDLGAKIHEKAGTLSGGQKRKLQLAAGMVGGSSIVLVDECTSGVDPLSRRALWRILRSVRERRTVVFTTHFLDEADLLGDTVAILAAPGKLVAQGTPVKLKSELGKGYVVSVSFQDDITVADVEKHAGSVLEHIRSVAPACQKVHVEERAVEFQLNDKDPKVVQAALDKIEEAQEEDGVKEVDVRGASLEGVFLDLMAKEEFATRSDPSKLSDEEKDSLEPTEPVLESRSSTSTIPGAAPAPIKLDLTSGRPQSFLRQTLTIFHKRTLIARRAWLTPLLAVLVAIAGACIPLVFLNNRHPSCVRRFQPSFPTPVYLPLSPEWNSVAPFVGNTTGTKVLERPAGVVESLGATVANVSTENLQSSGAFDDAVNGRYRNLSLGGVSFDFASGQEDKATFAWEASSPGGTGLVMLNLVNNILFNRALNASSGGNAAAGGQPTLILAHYEPFPLQAAGTLVALKWVAFFGAAMAVYPAFFSLYVSRERKSGVQAMQLSNGLSNPAGMWLGHFMFDSIFSVLAATVITIVFAAVMSTQFHGLGFFWLVMVLYGMAATLFAYCVSLVVSSPLAAFAATAGVQIVLFILYLAAYLLVLTYAKTSDADHEITIIHFTMSLLSPVASVMRAAFVSVNLFSLLCAGDEPANPGTFGDIMRYGGPVVYLIVQCFFYFAILVRRESGALFRRATRKVQAHAVVKEGLEGEALKRRREDVAAEAKRVADAKDALKVIKVSKAFEGKTVVDDVSFGADEGTTLALLGPNGAGKTTTFNMIRGDIVPTTGQILIQGKSIVSHPRAARLSLGVCPQFTAIDAQLTVAEHLSVYGRLKGLRPGAELRANVDQILRAAGLEKYRDREASRLSGGNQRKLALAIALMGNPSVVLIDEFSSGVDAKMKREMWGTLKAVAHSKAVVITTHSMEEASALANKVAILAKRMLAVGTTAELEARYATYEVHFSARTREDTLRAREVMVRVPGARAADDVATRFEVSVISTRRETEGEGLTLVELFGILSQEEMEFTVERPMLETVFLKVIKEHNVEEENEEGRKRSVWATLKRLI